MDTILTNSKARHEYHIEETFEAGIVLSGTEVKSLRAGKGQIRDAFARVEDNEIWLYNAHIDEYSHGNTANHQPKAKRKLLLHKREISKLFGVAAIKGKALVPLSFYWKKRQGEGAARCWPGQGRRRQAADNQKARQRPRAASDHDAPALIRLAKPKFTPTIFPVVPKRCSWAHHPGRRRCRDE